MQLIQHPPSVVLIPVDGGELVLVRQSRPGSGSRTLELPSGKLEEGETPVQAAARELAEECGLAAAELVEVATFWTAPAYSTELVHVFEASRLTKAGPAALDDAASIAALALWLERP